MGRVHLTAPVNTTQHEHVDQAYVQTYRSAVPPTRDTAVYRCADWPPTEGVVEWIVPASRQKHQPSGADYDFPPTPKQEKKKKFSWAELEMNQTCPVDPVQVPVSAWHAFTQDGLVGGSSLLGGTSPYHWAPPLKNPEVRRKERQAASAAFLDSEELHSAALRCPPKVRSAASWQPTDC